MIGFVHEVLYVLVINMIFNVYTVWHEIVAGSTFCDFFSHPQKLVPAKIYSRVTIL